MNTFVPEKDNARRPTGEGAQPDIIFYTCSDEKGSEPSLKDKSGVAAEFSSNLVALSKQHRAFLHSIHSLGISQHKPSAESVRRYRDLWLPLVANYSKIVEQKAIIDDGDVNCQKLEVEAVGIIPAADVAWLWHCHRLAPRRYCDYIKKVFAPPGNGSKNDIREACVLLEALPPFSLQHCSHHLTLPHSNDGMTVEPSTPAGFAAATNAQILWDKMYPTEPFFLRVDDKHDDFSCSGSGQEHDAACMGVLDGFDILASAERQRTFLWQISGPYFDNDDFLCDGVVNYKKFLHLRASPHGQSQIIVPTYQIDLMWHTHILSSLRQYEADCRRIMGHVFHHDDSLTDRSEGSNLDVAFRATKELWREVYGLDYIVEGGMYRGEPPQTYYESDFFHRCREDSTCGAGPFQHLIGKVGASSTNPAAGGATSGETTSIENRPDGSSVKTVQRTNPDGSTVTTVQTTSIDGSLTVSTTTRPPGGTTLHVDSNTTSPVEWIPVSGVTPDGRPAFVAGEPKLRIRGQNANPRKSDYVFGKHDAKGTGYYHTATKEANEILLYRLLVARSKKRSEVDCAHCVASCFFCFGSLKQDEAKKLRELEELEDMVAVAKSRTGVDYPVGAVGLPPNHRKYNDYYAADGTWIVPVDYMDAAACGGSKISGGACAGGACGASGCGGGGCGGGGCGGGGCGGGGCGG